MSSTDFTRDVALNYVKRGYHLLCRHAITLFLLPVGGTILVSKGLSFPLSPFIRNCSPRLWTKCVILVHCACIKLLRKDLWQILRTAGAGEHGKDRRAEGNVGHGSKDESAVQHGERNSQHVVMQIVTCVFWECEYCPYRVIFA